MGTATKAKRRPKYSLAYESRRSGEVQRGQHPTFSSLNEAVEACKQLNAARTFRASGVYVVIDL